MRCVIRSSRWCLPMGVFVYKQYVELYLDSHWLIINSYEMWGVVWRPGVSQWESWWHLHIGGPCVCILPHWFGWLSCQFSPTHRAGIGPASFNLCPAICQSHTLTQTGPDYYPYTGLIVSADCIPATWAGIFIKRMAMTALRNLACEYKTTDPVSVLSVA